MKLKLDTMAGYESLRMSMPKLKVDHKTSKFAYMARTDGDTDAGIVIKFDRKNKIVMYGNGTWAQLP